MATIAVIAFLYICLALIFVLVLQRQVVALRRALHEETIARLEAESRHLKHVQQLYTNDTSAFEILTSVQTTLMEVLDRERRRMPEPPS